MKYTAEQIKSILKNAPSGSQFYTDGYDVKYRKVIGDKYFGYLDEAKGWVETCDKQLSQERIDKGWWLPNLLKELENQMNIDKVETQTPEEKEALDSIVSKITQDNSLVGGLASAMSNVRNAIKGNQGAVATEHPEEMSALISLNRMNESVEDFLDGLKGENEWSGEGLPPVGVWFEISANMANTVWNKCRVVHYHNNLAWLDFECNEIMNMIKNLNNNVIRPTETPQQREDRERLEAAYDLYWVWMMDYNTLPEQVKTMEDFTDDTEEVKDWLRVVDKTNYRKGA